MPKTKNQGKNKSRFEVRGGVINEFEFALNEGAMTAEEHQLFLRQEDERRAGEGVPAEATPQTEAERIPQLTNEVREKVARKKQKQSGQAAAKSSAKKRGAGSKSVGVKKAGASKSAAKKAGPKKAGAKGATKKGAAKKSAARKGAARKTGRAR
jgi:hypothetical protein